MILSYLWSPFCTSIQVDSPGICITKINVLVSCEPPFLRLSKHLPIYHPLKGLFIFFHVFKGRNYFVCCYCYLCCHIFIGKTMILEGVQFFTVFFNPIIVLSLDLISSEPFSFKEDFCCPPKFISR